MTDEDKIRRALKQKLGDQRNRTNALREDASATKRLGHFLSEICREKGWSAHDLALKLDIEEALVDAILSGILPRSQIDDDFLIDISQVVGCDFNALKQVLDQDTAR